MPVLKNISGNVISCIVVFLSILLLPTITINGQHKTPVPIIWKLKDPSSIGGFKSLVLGNPITKTDSKVIALSFNGVSDGVILDTNPIKDWSKFTIEVLFRPESGISAPRFIHFHDTSDNRGTLEVRVTADSTWYLDTFLYNGRTNSRLTLIDSTKTHPCNRWYWVSLVYDGDKMRSYVNGIKQGEGPVSFISDSPGKISIGVRLNKVNWFRGQISEIRFHPIPLTDSRLSRF